MAKRDRESLQKRFMEEGKTAYVSTESADAAIKAEHYHHFEGTTVTVCVIELVNGFTVIGKGACANPGNFDAELGKELARDDAYNQIFPHLAFMLCESGAVPAITPEAFPDLFPSRDVTADVLPEAPSADEFAEHAPTG